jgi:hypothetical protein
MNEEKYTFMKDLVLFGGARCCFASPLSLTLLLSLFLSLSLSLSWYASLFDGTMPSTLAIVEAMTRPLRRFRRNCGPRGSIASTIVGALCCECFVGFVADGGYALIDRTALVFLSLCGGLDGADLLANAIIAMPVVDFDVCDSFESVGRLLQPLGAPRAPVAAEW